MVRAEYGKADVWAVLVVSNELSDLNWLLGFYKMNFVWGPQAVYKL